MGPTYTNIVAITNLQIQLWNSPQRNCGNLYYQLHPLIGPQWQPWQLMQLDIATLPAFGTLAIGTT
jgi:hypothetical protein